MKKVLFSMIAFALVLTTSSCSDDDDDSGSNLSTSQISSIARAGDWRILNFSEDGVDNTNDFTGYLFTFEENNVLNADNGTNAYDGSWAVTDNSDDDDSSDVDMNIIFGFGDFASLSEDWEVLSASTTTILLRHVSGGNGTIDYLTFQKN